MRPLHRNLLIVFGLAAVVYGGLALLKQKLSEPSEEGVAKNVTHRLGPRAEAERENNLSSAEVQKLLKQVVIPTVNFQNVTLADALEFVNGEIAKQIPKLQPRTKVLMDLAALKWSKERHRFDSQNEELKAALGDIELKSFDEMEIEELRVRNIPAEVLLDYICAATKTYRYIYKGDVYLTIGCEACSRWSFFNEEVFNAIHLNRVPADQLVSALGEIIDAHEYRGQKTDVLVCMSENARKALKNSEIEMPVISTDFHNITLSQALRKMAEESGGMLVMKHQESCVLIYDPLKEGIGNLEDPFHPDADAKPGGRFDVILDKNWDKPPPAQKPTE